ncbi:porphobilinogen deaminase [Fulvitalea axinellae]|uniref:Porphobilinogen deaminase n=1 Tax=Fulvitalea axinellae TaxID=1182444 RepID=A0AAU9CFQ4_9BACT|nr:porphobilinogen deaminase [Fulvitalea axinellae]
MRNDDTIRIGTRKSKLALWQAYHIADLLERGGLKTEIVKIETKGDKILDVTISKIGSKGVFTEEIEDKLQSGEIDIAVHSAKDMQSELPEGFELIAFTERERVNDVIVSRDKSISLADSSREIILGTSSNRRLATLNRYYPHIKTVPVRGNLQRRIEKMDEGQCDALLLAFAGVHRMEYDDMIAEILPLDTFTPAVGQGSVAVEAHANLDPARKERIRELTNHPETEICLLAERSFLKTMQGGCSVPVYALASLTEDKEVKLTGGILSLDGKEEIKLEKHMAQNSPETLGNEVAYEILEKGGDRILTEIKKALGRI